MKEKNHFLVKSSSWILWSHLECHCSFPSTYQHSGNNWDLWSLPVSSASVLSINLSFIGFVWQHREIPKIFPFKNKVPQGLIHIQEQIQEGTFIHQLAKSGMIGLFKQFLGNEQGGEC